MANGEFVQALPNAYRARAFGVVQGGLHLFQGVAVLATGFLAANTEGQTLPTVVGLWSLGGVGLMIVLILFWPSPEAFAEAGARAAAVNGPHVGNHRAPEPA